MNAVENEEDITVVALCSYGAKDVEEEAPRKEDVWKSGEQQGEKGCFLGFISRAKSRGVFEQSVCVCVYLHM